LRPHQQNARSTKVLAGLVAHDRGKLIMACGTGKTFTSLKIAEENGRQGQARAVPRAEPRAALADADRVDAGKRDPLHSFAVCSDSDVGKKRKKDDDTVQTFVHELRYPATTDAARSRPR
jgi:predicted helicase